MTKLSQIISKILLLMLFIYSADCLGQTSVRLPFTKVKSNINTGQDYSPWLNDNIKDFVQNVWVGNQRWVDLTLPLEQHSIVTRVSFYDMEGTFADMPDTIFAVNNGKKTFIGTFTGPYYQTWDGFTLKVPAEADAIVIRKFGNNIPQKVRIFGYSDVNSNRDANLSNISLSNGKLDPVFNPLLATYKVVVNNKVTSLQITPTAEATRATIKVNGKDVVTGQTSVFFPLVVGTNTEIIKVTSPDKSVVRTYTLTVTRNRSSVDNLLGLTISNGKIIPEFKPGILNYTTTVASNVNFVRETPLAGDLTSVIKVNGLIVPSGTASPILPLAPGPNVIRTVVTAQDKITSRTYITTVIRTPLPNTTLAGLTLSAGKLSPAFKETVLNYTTNVLNGVDDITVTPKATDANAVVKVNNQTVVSGKPSAAIPLAIGSNTIKVIVTENGKATVTYTLLVIRGGSTNANLSNLVTNISALTPLFKQSVLNYTVTVINAITNIKIIPTVEDVTATVKVNGTAVASGKSSVAIDLAPGTNVINIEVTAQDNETVQMYTVRVNRIPATGANLTNLIPSSGTLSPGFNTSVLKYTASVSNSVSSITLTPTSADGATIQINGTTIASGAASAAIPLEVGTNSIRIVVIAQDQTRNNYDLTVTRLTSSNDNLASLTLSGTRLTPAFNSSILTYITAVSNRLGSTVVSPVASDINSTIKVNGIAVAANGSATITLPIGITTINTVVTAPDGSTAKTYSVVVTRPDTTILPPDSTVNPPDTTSIPPDTTKLVKIPIDPSRWYMFNNVSNGLNGLFDGITNVNVGTGYGQLFSTYDCIYPVLPGEAINLKQIKFYSYQGGLASPFTVSVIDNAGVRTPIASYIGNVYQAWLGPYPGKSGFDLTTTVKNIKYIVLTVTSGFPTEMEFDGYYSAPPDTTPVVRKSFPLRQYFGANAFEWNFEDPNNTLVVSTTMLTAMKSFTQVRHYMDWDKLESTPGKFTYDPIHSGGWNYDAIYKACQTNGMVVLADLKTQPSWMVATWPAGQQDSENVPVIYGKDFGDPNSYLEQAKIAFQFAARYGTNPDVNSSLLSVDLSIRWTNDPPNAVKKGLGLITYIECDNERDKWWKGPNAYQNCYQYAANLSAFYDGNKNTMGPGVGVKNADPNMQVVIGGLCSGDPAYIHGMVEWCKQHRGYKADGTVNLCWDIINYHFYASDGVDGTNATTGVAPELGTTAKLAQGYLKMAHQYAYDQEVWVTESGYDLNTGSPQRAPAIGAKTAQLVEADWILRTSLLYARLGIARVFFYEAHDDNAANPMQYSSSGLINDDQSRRPAADFLYQTNKLFGTFKFVKTLNSDPIVDNYQTSDGNNMYMLVVPDQKGRTASYSLDMNGADSAYVYNPKVGSTDMTVNKVKLTDGKLTVNVTETPTFITPSGIAGGGKPAAIVNSLVTNTVVDATSLNSITLYPNPTKSSVTVAFTNKATGLVTIKVTDVNMNKTYKTYTFTKNGDNFSNTIDISNAPMGVCIVQVLQGDQSIMRKEIKSN